MSQFFYSPYLFWKSSIFCLYHSPEFIPFYYWAVFHCMALPGQEYPLDKGMATHSSILAWKFHGQRSLVSCSPRGRKELNTAEWLTLLLIDICIVFSMRPFAINLPWEKVFGRTYVFILWHKYQEFLGYNGNCMIHLLRKWHTFLEYLCYFIFLPTMNENFICFTSWQHLILSVFSHLAILMGVVVSHCDFNLHFSDD